MSEKTKTYKFTFTAEITKLLIKAKVSSPVVAVWKRSSQSASTTAIEMVDGKGMFDQTIQLPVNMYFDVQKNVFLEKKSVFNFTMNTPKGDKSAGVVYVDLAKILNDKLDALQKDFTLQKCPVKDSYVHIRISGQFESQKNADTMSQNQSFAVNSSMMSIPGDQSPTKKKESEKEVSPERKVTNSSKDTRVSQLQQKVRTLEKEKQQLQNQVKGLRKELERNKRSNTSTNSTGGQNSENQLNNIKNKLEFIYDRLKNNFSQVN